MPEGDRRIEVPVAVALARKLAVIMHAMLRTGELFDPHGGTATAA